MRSALCVQRSTFNAPSGGRLESTGSQTYNVRWCDWAIGPYGKCHMHGSSQARNETSGSVPDCPTIGPTIDPTIITRDRDVDIANIAGFLSLDTPRAETLHTELLEREVFTDWRDTVLRFGPSPYLDDDQLGEAMTLLGEVIRELP